jgi:predicted transcriptional regulator
VGPDDIELGDEALEVERSPRPGLVVSIRLTADEADELERVAARRRSTVTGLAREALRQYLAQASREPAAT